MADEKKASPFVEVGVSGLQRQGGVVYEEFLRELQGERWRRTIKQMVDTDEIVGAILFSIEMLIRRSTWDVIAKDPSNEAQQSREFFHECLFSDMSATFQDTLSEILSFLWWGWSYLEIVYKMRAGETSNPTKRSKFTDNKIGWRKWAIRSQDSLDGWEFDEGGGVKGLWQQDFFTQQNRVFIPIAKALHFKTTSRKTNPEAKSILRNAYKSWYYKTHIGRIEAIGVERDLAGYPVMKIPAEVINADGPAYTQWKNVAVNLRRDEQEALVIPSDRDDKGNAYYEVQLLSTGGSRQLDTDKIINRYDSRIAMSVLADFVLLGHEKVGSFALSKNKSNLFTTALQAWEDSIADVINRFAIPRLAVLNGMNQDVLPTVQHGEVTDIDLTELGDYISKLSGSGMPIFPTADGALENHLLEVASLPTAAPEEISEDDSDVETPKVSELFEYHLKYGVVTINEARAMMGLKPIEGGDKPAIAMDTSVPAQVGDSGQ